MKPPRPAVLADLEAIVAANIALARESEGLALDPVRVRDGVRAVLAGDAAARYWVVEDDAGTFLGQAMVTLEWSDWRNANIWWLQSVYVAPTHRRLGIFRTLYDFIAREAQTAGAPSLRLYVEAQNLSAQRTYAAVGMRAGHYFVFESQWGHE